MAAASALYPLTDHRDGKGGCKKSPRAAPCASPQSQHHPFVVLLESRNQASFFFFENKKKSKKQKVTAAAVRRRLGGGRAARSRANRLQHTRPAMVQAAWARGRRGAAWMLAVAAAGAAAQTALPGGTLPESDGGVAKWFRAHMHDKAFYVAAACTGPDPTQDDEEEEEEEEEEEGRKKKKKKKKKKKRERRSKPEAKKTSEMCGLQTWRCCRQCANTGIEGKSFGGRASRSNRCWASSSCFIFPFPMSTLFHS